MYASREGLRGYMARKAVINFHKGLRGKPGRREGLRRNGAASGWGLFASLEVVFALYMSHNHEQGPAQN
jgi:hypothetical protein